MNLPCRTLDVCAAAGALTIAQLSLDGTTLDYGPVDLSQPRLWSRAVPPNLKDLRVRDGLVTATQGAASGPDHAVRLTATETTDLGVCYGLWATALCVLNGNLKILVVRDPFVVEWLTADGESLKHDPIGIPGGTALGILQAFDDGTIAWAQSGDGYTTRTVNGVTLTLPRTDGAIWTGQAHGQTLACLPDGSVRIVADREGHDIRIASANGQTAIASWAPTEDGGAFLVVAPPWPDAPVSTMPEVSQVTPARSDLRLGTFMFNGAPAPEPNPHLPFGSFTIPVRLSNLPSGDIINAGQDNGHPISFFAGEDGSQTFIAAVAKQRPFADAAGVGLSLYVDHVPFTADDLALYRPGDVLMPQVTSVAALEPAKALISAGYPVVLSVGVQRMAPADAAQLIIAASSVECFGSVIFAKDRSDVPWDALTPYLDRWNSGVESPAPWPMPPAVPHPEPPDPLPTPDPEPDPMPTPTLIRLVAQHGQSVRTQPDHTLTADAAADDPKALFEIVLLENTWSNGRPIALRQDGLYVSMKIQDLLKGNVTRVWMANHEAEEMTVWTIRRGVKDLGGWGFDFPGIGQLAADSAGPLSCHANPQGIDGAMRFHIFNAQGQEITDDFTPSVGGNAPQVAISGVNFIEGGQ